MEEKSVPWFVTQRYKKPDVRVAFSQLHYGIIVQVIVMIMTDNDNVYGRNILDVAWHFSNSFWSHELHWTASLREHWIEQGTEATGELDIETSMAKPRRSEFFGFGRTSW